MSRKITWIRNKKYFSLRNKIQIVFWMGYEWRRGRFELFWLLSFIFPRLDDWWWSRFSSLLFFETPFSRYWRRLWLLLLLCEYKRFCSQNRCRFSFAVSCTSYKWPTSSALANKLFKLNWLQRRELKKKIAISTIS